MKKIYLLLLLFFPISLFSQNYTSSKKYKDVIEHFKLNYYNNEISYEIKFAKKLSDWYVHVYNLENNKLVREELFWNEKENKFFKINFPEGKSEEINFFFIDNTINLFENCMPNIGYKGYYFDNINLLSNKKEFTDDELYVLGRSYSLYSSNLLYDQYGIGLDSIFFSKNIFQQNSLTEIQEKKYIELVDSGIYYFKLLKDRNPNYDTKIVGSITTKWSNEFIYKDMTLRQVQNDKTADKYFPKDIILYDDFMLFYAKLFLSQCPKNAILFVSGDNDTYPLLYYQKKFNYRKDVQVINTSLLGLNIYINYLFDTKKVPISFRFNKDQKTKLDFLISKGKDEIYLDKFISLLKQKLNIADKDQDENYLNFGYINFTMMSNNIKYSISKIMFKNDIMILDIINKNQFKRPICFSYLFNEFNTLSKQFLNYTTFNGFVYEFNSYGYKYQPIKLNTDYLDKKILVDKEFNFPENNLSSDYNIEVQYKSLLFSLIEKHTENNNLEIVKKYLDFYYEKFFKNESKINETDFLVLEQILLNGNEQIKSQSLAFIERSLNNKNVIETEKFGYFKLKFLDLKNKKK